LKTFNLELGAKAYINMKNINSRYPPPKSSSSGGGLGRFAPFRLRYFFYQINTLPVRPTGRVLSDLAPDGTENVSIYLIYATDRQSFSPFGA